jgi:hypothetical protein
MLKRIPLVVMAALVAASVGCEPPAEGSDTLPEADLMQGAPLFLPSSIKERRGSAETIELVFTSPVSADSIADWYRVKADTLRWEILADVTRPNGTTTMHFRRNGPPLWVIVQPAAEGTGTEFRLIGAAPDTTQRQP